VPISFDYRRNHGYIEAGMRVAHFQFRFPKRIGGALELLDLFPIQGRCGASGKIEILNFFP
jgi:hypothetical protein